MNWNGIERMRAVLSGELLDRVPFLPTIYTDFACQACNHDFADALKDPLLGNRLMLKAALACGTDAVRFVSVPGHDWFGKKEVVESDGQLVQFDRTTGARGGSAILMAGVPSSPTSRLLP